MTPRPLLALSLSVRVNRCVIRSTPLSQCMARMDTAMPRLTVPSSRVFDAVRMWVLSWMAPSFAMRRRFALKFMRSSSDFFGRVG